MSSLMDNDPVRNFFVALDKARQSKAFVDKHKKSEFTMMTNNPRMCQIEQDIKAYALLKNSQLRENRRNIKLIGSMKG